MAALDRLFDDEPSRPVSRKPKAAPPQAEFLPLMPMLQPVDEPRLENRPHRFLVTSELDGPEFMDAADAGDAYAVERDRVLYGELGGSTRAGWSDEDRAA